MISEENVEEITTKEKLTLFGKVFALLLLFTVILGVLSFLSADRSSNSQMPEAVAKTYHNTKFNLNFSYPEDWNQTTNYYDSGTIVCLNPPRGTGDCSIQVTEYKNRSMADVMDMQEKIFADYNIETGKTTILSRDAKLLTITGYETGREGFSRVIVFEAGDNIYTAGAVDRHEEVFSDLLNSFSVVHAHEDNSHSTSSDAWKTYTNEDYGFSFRYPDWRTGNLDIENAFQLYNYTVNEVGNPATFREGQNKITGSVVERGFTKESSVGVRGEHPSGTVEEVKKVAVQGRIINRVKHQGFLTYEIPLNSNGKLLPITIFGDPDNFYILDKVISTLDFSTANNLNTNKHESWKTYKNDEYGFSFQYPDFYSDFSGINEASGFDPTGRLYIESAKNPSYPSLSVEIFPLDIFNGSTDDYETHLRRRFSLDYDMERESLSIKSSYDGQRIIGEVAVGEKAGFALIDDRDISSSEYVLIPIPEKEIMIEIELFSDPDTTKNFPDIDRLLSSFHFF